MSIHNFVKICLGLLILTGLITTLSCGYLAITKVAHDVALGTAFLLGMIASLSISVAMLTAYTVGFGFLDLTD